MADTTIETVDVRGLAKAVAGLANNGQRRLRMTRIGLEHGPTIEQAVRREAWRLLQPTRPARRVETPAARASDPASSHEAAEAVTASGQRTKRQRIVAATVAMHPGCTSRELTQHCALDRYEIARRLPECETGKTVKKGDMRRCQIGGKRVTTWWPA